MKIVLISTFGGIHSLGIRYLSSLLKNKGFNCHLIFLPRLKGSRGDFDDIESPYSLEILNDIYKLTADADLIGFSVMTSYFFRVVEITKFLKSKLTTPIIWGGIHPTVEPDECLKYADIICRGEGESALLELVENLKNKKSYSKIKNIWFKRNNEIIKNELRPLNQELDDLRFPDYDISNHYILNNNHIELMTLAILEEKMPKITTKENKLLTAYPIFCTRGCPHNCSYCCNDSLRRLYPGQKYIRRRTVDNIIKELKTVINKFSFIKSVRVEDDSFLVAPKEEIIEFCKKYKKEINLPFICLSSPVNVSEEKINFLIKAGMIGIQLGIQSGSDELNKNVFTRNIPYKKVLEATKIIYKYRKKLIPPRYDIITDNPWEKKSDLIKTIKLLSRIPGRYVLNVYSLVFYPGTAIYNRALSDGFLDTKNKVYSKDWLKVKMDYLKFIIFLNRFSTFKIPKKIINFLLKPRTIKIGERFNFIYGLLYSIIYKVRLVLPI